MNRRIIINNSARNKATTLIADYNQKLCMARQVRAAYRGDEICIDTQSSSNLIGDKKEGSITIKAISDPPSFLFCMKKHIKNLMIVAR